MTRYPKYLGLRILVGGAMVDRSWFDTSFTTHMERTLNVVNALQMTGIDCMLTQEQIDAARDGHASQDMKQVFVGFFWPTYDSERSLGNIRPIMSEEGFWTPEDALELQLEFAA
jgi:hypothetical protein